MIETLTSLVQAAADAAGLDATVPPVAPSKKPGLGDYQSNCAFQLAKAARKPPRAVGELLAAHMPEHPALARVEVAGPGFLNLHLADDWLGARCAEQCQGHCL